MKKGEEKKNFKEKAKEFYGKHKGAIIGAGIGGTLVILKSYNMMTYRKGFIDGGAVGFGLIMNWFDENFGTNLKEIYEKFAKEHPEQIVDYKIK